jgi:hypothetical protein
MLFGPGDIPRVKPFGTPSSAGDLLTPEGLAAAGDCTLAGDALNEAGTGAKRGGAAPDFEFSLRQNKIRA